jgi:hypothetical protein
LISKQTQSPGIVRGFLCRNFITDQSRGPVRWLAGAAFAEAGATLEQIESILRHLPMA